MKTKKNSKPTTTPATVKKSERRKLTPEQLKEIAGGAGDRPEPATY